MVPPSFANPFRPGAGHMPPYLAGRQDEVREFESLLQQDVILKNLIITGLRGVGKTVLLESLKPVAQSHGWAWAGTDLSESTSVAEDTIAVRLCTDLSLHTNQLKLKTGEKRALGFSGKLENQYENLNFNVLLEIYERTPGLIADKVRAVLEISWRHMNEAGLRGLIFAYDEAQTMSDHAEKLQYPLSLLLDVFQSIQRKGIPFMLVLTGLPTLFVNLVEARTYTERMFRVLFLNRLDAAESREAVERPVEQRGCPITLTEDSVSTIVNMSGGYPYFIQFICREVYDVLIQKIDVGSEPIVSYESIVHKLDTDFFAGRWGRATERQQDLMKVIASLDNHDGEFTTQEVADQSKTELAKGFSPSHVNQMLSNLSNHGFVYKNRYGRYLFAVPLLGDFIRRQQRQDQPDLFR